MKRQNRQSVILKILTDAGLLTCAMLASVCALPSAFSVPFERVTMIWMCVLASFLLSGWLHLPRGGIAFGAVFLAMAAIYSVFDRGEIADGARYTWYHILTPLSGDFSFLPVPAPIEELENPAAAVTAFLVIVAIVFGMLIAFALIRGKIVSLTLLLPLPLYLAGLVYTNQPPALWTAILLLVFDGGVLFGHGMRQHRTQQRGLLTAMALPLLVLLALALRVASPPRNYTPIPFEQRQAMLGRTIGELRDQMLSWIKRNPKNVNLSGESGRTQDEEKAFSIYVTTAGEYLLRTRSYGHYKNGFWMAAEEYDGNWTSMAALGRGQEGEWAQINIREAFSGERIVPYGFWKDSEVDFGESYVHAQGRTAYGWVAQRAETLVPHEVDADERDYIAFAMQQYTMENGAEKRALLRILDKAGIRAGEDPYQTALNVASFVRGSASYTLQPGKIPDDADFVQYFLTQGHKGYCVHFASATTALLQALNIPARYTVGYSVTVPISGVLTDVPGSASHAWTEVYIAGVGWIPIESTAGFGESPFRVEPGSGDVSTGMTGYPSATPRATPAAVSEPKETEALPTLEPKPGETRAPAPQPTEQAGGQHTGTVIREEPARRVSAWWLLLLLIPVLSLGWLAAGSVIRKRRKHAFLQKNAKEGILAMTAYAHQLERCGKPFDPELDEWAEEAMFSNHPMVSKRKEAYRRITEAQEKLYRDQPIKRFWYKWILFRF